MKKFIPITIKQPEEDGEVTLINSIISVDNIEGVYQSGDEVIVDYYNRSEDEVQQMVVDNSINYFVDQLPR